MPVVINEFEVVAEPPAPAAPPKADAPGAPAEAPVSWTVFDIEQVVRRLEERAARLRAD